MIPTCWYYPWVAPSQMASGLVCVAKRIWQSDDMLLPRLSYERHCDLSLFLSLCLSLSYSLFDHLFWGKPVSLSGAVQCRGPYSEELKLMATSQQGTEASLSSCISELGNRICSPSPDFRWLQPWPVALLQPRERLWDRIAQLRCSQIPDCQKRCEILFVTLCC